MKYHIVTFGCQQNEADSERIASYYQARGFEPARGVNDADLVIVNTCMVRRKAEDRVLGLVNNLRKLKKSKIMPSIACAQEFPKAEKSPSPTQGGHSNADSPRAGKSPKECPENLSESGCSKFDDSKSKDVKIVVTGCMVGAAMKDEKYGKWIRKVLKDADQFLPIEEVGFEYHPVRKYENQGLVPIMHGCNNFCSYCIVPYARGREHSREIENILEEIQEMADNGYKEVMLLGQNVNSFGADLVMAQKNNNDNEYILPNGVKISPVFVKHLGKKRIPTLFPYLLDEVCKIKGIEKVSFMSSNPWDFSDELIDVIAKNPKINREIHLPVQSGDDEILQKMNRWYTAQEYFDLIQKIRDKVPGVSFTTDIIVGFPGEKDKQFQNTISLCKKVGFNLAYISCYSPRPGTVSEREYEDNVPLDVKKERFRILDGLINRDKAQGTRHK
jgi:tRNA-2-methylthio-N6-dimethylallyladenosine synthase